MSLGFRVWVLGLGSVEAQVSGMPNKTCYGSAPGREVYHQHTKELPPKANKILNNIVVSIFFCTPL